MRKTNEWFRVVLSCGVGALLFACSSKEKQMEASVQPSATMTATALPLDASTADNALQMVRFSTNAYNLSTEARKALTADAAWLKSKEHRSEKFEIRGYCDERGSAKYNDELGTKRAKAVKNYLVKLGLKSSRMKVVSYGLNQPLDPGHDEEAWAKNRRAATVISTQHLSQAN